MIEPLGSIKLGGWYHNATDYDVAVHDWQLG